MVGGELDEGPSNRSRIHALGPAAAIIWSAVVVHVQAIRAVQTRHTCLQLVAFSGLTSDSSVLLQAYQKMCSKKPHLRLCYDFGP